MTERSKAHQHSNDLCSPLSAIFFVCKDVGSIMSAHYGTILKEKELGKSKNTFRAGDRYCSSCMVASGGFTEEMYLLYMFGNIRIKEECKKREKQKLV